MATIGILLLNVIGGLAGALAVSLVLRQYSLGIAGNCLAGIVGGCLGGQMIHMIGRGQFLFLSTELLAGIAFGAGLVLLFGFIRRNNPDPNKQVDQSVDPLMVDSQLNS